MVSLLAKLNDWLSQMPMVWKSISRPRVEEIKSATEVSRYFAWKTDGEKLVPPTVSQANAFVALHRSSRRVRFGVRAIARGVNRGYGRYGCAIRR